MPTYEYRCPKCGHAFDLFQKMSDDPVAECAECGGAARRLISGGAGLLFKGEGFYVTDYRSEGYKKAAREGAGDGSSSRKDEGGRAELGKGGRAETGKGGSEGGDKTKPAPAKTIGAATERSGPSESAPASSRRGRSRRGRDSGGPGGRSPPARDGGKDR